MFLCVVGGGLVGFAAGLFLLFPLFAVISPASSVEVIGWGATYVGVAGGVIGGVWIGKRW